MIKRAGLYGAVLIGLYIAVSHGTAGGQLLGSAGSAGAGFVKALQGR